MREGYKEIQLIDLVKLILNMWWVIIITVTLFSTSAYYYSKNNIVPIYTAKTTIFIGKEDGVLATIKLTDLQIGEQLVIDYTQLVKTNQVLEKVIEKFQIEIEPSELLSMIKVEIIKGSRFMEISVTHSDPEFASKLVDSVSEILKVKAEEIVGASNIQIVDYSKIPQKPTSPNIILNTLIAFVLGCVLSLIVILTNLLLDNKIKHSEDLELITQSPLLGSIQKMNVDFENKLILNQDYSSSIAESYRMIRTNLHYINSDNTKKVILFTSAIASEGKTTTVSNIATVFAQAGKKVLLIDCDLRRSQVHKMFGMLKSEGVTNVLSNSLSFDKALKEINELKNLHILTSGPTPPNPAELLAGNNIETLIANARRDYDVVLIDSPPVLLASDGLNMSKLVDGIVLVAAYKETKKEDLVKVKSSLDKVGYKILGTVLTKTKYENKDYYASK